MPLQQTSGAASYDGFGGGVPVVPKYIEEYFSTFLYQGTGASNTINNGIDLSTKGGLVWIKQRNQATSHRLFDTARGVQNSLASNSTAATASFSGYLTAFNTNGFTVGSANDVNESGFPLTSWSIAKAPKFFDVVTYTGNGGAQLVNHSLGSTPGCIIAKRTDSTGNWEVWHRDLNFGTDGLLLNSTAAATSGNSDISSVNSTRFGVLQTTAFNINVSGATYVAYVFAHNAGGFGLTGTDNVISCGSYTGNGSTQNITLGYEPQWVLIKDATSTDFWSIFDNMRGMPVSGSDAQLAANSANAENTVTGIAPTATGFSLSSTSVKNTSTETYIYIAIRRGPMKVPTDPYQVFSPLTRTGTGSTTSTSGVGFPTDIFYTLNRPGSLNAWYMQDRLRGNYKFLQTTGTGAEASLSNTAAFDNMDGVNLGANGAINGISTYIDYYFRRAPSFFDEVCYTGTGTAARNITHNLTVAPEMIIVKGRTNTEQWPVWATSIAYGSNNYLSLASAVASGNTDVLNYNETTNTAVPPTSTTFTVGTHPRVNGSGVTYVAYLFATCAGVSKCGTFTGTGTTQQVDCGFTGGARFVLIKRTDSTGDWYVWDSARGIVSGNDPYLLLNSTAAEVTITDYIDTYSAGFELSTTAAATVNVLNGTYIYLAIA